MAKQNINCPCCESTLNYKEEGSTHLWTCPECPVVMFEFYGEEDVLNVKHYLLNEVGGVS